MPKRVGIPKVTIRERSGGYQADVTWQGVRKRPQFGTRKEAEIWAADQTARMARGLPLEDPAPKPMENFGGTVVTMKDLYLHTCDVHWKRSRNVSSAKKLMQEADIVVKALGPDTKVKSLTSRYIDQQLALMQASRKNSVGTTNRRKSALTVMLGRAEREFDGWRAPIVEKEDEYSARSFRIEPQLEADMLRWFLNRGMVDFYDYVILSIYLGQRENEILRLRFAESSAAPFDAYIDDDDVIFPRQIAKTKSKFSRFVPMRPIVQEVIERRRKLAKHPTDRVLPEIFDQGYINRNWNLMRADLVKNEHPDIVAQKKLHENFGHDFVPHIMRHEFCCRLGDAGFDLAEIMKFSGHLTASVAMRYVKDNKVALRERRKKTADFDPLQLPCGDVPEFAPSLTPDLEALPASKRTSPAKKPAEAAAVDPTVAALLQALSPAQMQQFAAALAAKTAKP